MRNFKQRKDYDEGYRQGLQDCSTVLPAMQLEILRSIDDFRHKIKLIDDDMKNFKEILEKIKIGKPKQEVRT